MGQAESITQYLPSGESIALRILYIAYTAMAYFISFSCIYPILDAVADNVSVLGPCIWLLLMASRVLHVGAIIVCIASALAYRESSSSSQPPNIVDKLGILMLYMLIFGYALVLPWLPIFILFAPLAITLYIACKGAK